MTRPITFEQAKAQYVHRFTMEHVPNWAKEVRECGGFYAPQYRTDREWYDNTVFPGEGDLSRRERQCMSLNPSWPIGQRLVAVYRREGNR